MGVFLRDCPHCPATNSSFTVHAERVVGDKWHVFATCASCDAGIVAATFRKINASGPHGTNGNVEAHGLRVIETWPRRVPTSAPDHTPPAIAARFRDGEFNFQNGRWNAAVGMYRAALDLSTKDLNADGNTFFKRLENLATQGRVTPDIRAWADHVRVDGNEALHDPEEFTKEDAEPLRHFTEMFLRYVFEMPGRVAEFRGDNKN